jgi:hypothetical protein
MYISMLLRFMPACSHDKIGNLDMNEIILISHFKKNQSGNE